MKLLLRIILFIACQNVLSVHAQRTCQSHQYLQQTVQRDPSLKSTLESAERLLTNPSHTGHLITEGNTPGALPSIRIPVVVHIVYSSAENNISDAQVRSQIEVLNKDFNKLNADTVLIPSIFQHLASGAGIRFELATTDPNGRATSGIVRRKTGIQFFGLDDRIKNTARGGSDGWDADRYLNIWVGRLASGLIGYASPVGGAKETDGVVIAYTAFGAMGTAAIPYNKGRTATHEIGHWLGLRHIWGDTYCGNDYVDDTPPQRNSSFGCPSGVVTTCDNAPTGNMYMNFMDLTDDACVMLFTKGQTARMRRLFAEGGARHAILSSNGCSENPLPAEGPLPGDSEDEITLRVYPNPVPDLLTITGGQGLAGSVVNIYNHAGALMMRTNLSKTVPQVSVAHLQDGIYYLRIEGCGKPVKFIKSGSR